MKQAGWPNLLAGSMGLCALHSCCGSPQCLRRSLAFRPASGVRNVRVGRPSVLDVVGEAPRAAGGRRARRAGRRQLHESLYVALVRGDVREKKPTLEATVARAALHLRILAPAFPMTWRVVIPFISIPDTVNSVARPVAPVHAVSSLPPSRRLLRSCCEGSRQAASAESYALQHGQ